MPEARSVAVGVWVGVGARDEPAELAGVSHFLEHLLFKGTDDRSARAIADADRPRRRRHERLHHQGVHRLLHAPAGAGAVELGLELLGDVLSAPALRDDDVESERQVILEELAHGRGHPRRSRAHAALRVACSPTTRSGARRPASATTVGAITPDERAGRSSARGTGPPTWWWRPPARSTTTTVVAEVERAFSFAATAGDGARARTPQRTACGRSPCERRRTEQAHLALGCRRPAARATPTARRSTSLNHVLGGGMSSRLFDEIREQRGLAYARVLGAGRRTATPARFTVYAGTAPAQVDEVLDLVDAELDRFVADGISPDELEVAVGYLTGSFVLGLEDPASRMGRHGTQLTVFDGLRPVDTQVARYEAVTRDDVVRVAERILAGRRSLAVVGPVARKSFIARVA